MDNIHLSNIAKSEAFVQFLEDLRKISDPRIDRCKKHELSNIIFIIILGMLCGANNITSISNFAVRTRDKLEVLLALRNGVPSRSTLSRAIAMLNPIELALWRDKLQNNEMSIVLEHQLVVDGKKDSANKFYAVRVFDVQNMCVVRQEEVPLGANEITSASSLFETLQVKNMIVSGDAIYTHRSNVRKIVSHGGYYLFALKKNQRELYDDVAFYLENIENDRELIGTYDKCRTTEKSRNRFEVRECTSTGNIEWLSNKNGWWGLRSISMIKTIRSINGVDSINTRFFISSLEPKAKKILSTARQHWTIENLCHRHLDIAFEEDRSTVARRRSSMNLSIFRDFALSILQHTDSHESLRERRISNHYQIELLLERLFLPAFK